MLRHFLFILANSDFHFLQSWNGHLHRGDDGGDECEMNLAKSAAFVRDAKP